jgi:hypothetical protein
MGRQRAEQKVPSPTPPGSAATEEDKCSLPSVTTKDLQTLRSVILDQLASRAADRDDFLKGDAKLPADCIRLKAIYYIRSLARAKNPG